MGKGVSLFKKTVSAIMMILLVLGTITLVFRIQPVLSQPTTIIVPDDYPTIQAAINAANAGDTVYVRNGVYPEHIDINKTITLTGESNQNTTIIADAFGWEWSGINITANDVTVENFNITAGVGPLGGIIYVDGSGYSDDVIKNNNIASAANVVCDSLDIWYSKGNIVEGNRIVIGDNSSSGIGAISSDNMVCDNTIVGGWACILVILGDDNNVSNNYVTGQTLSGGFSDVGAIDLTSTSGDVVVGNTLFNNSIGLSVDEGDCSVYHNNFINNNRQALTENGSQIAFDNGYPSGGNCWSDYTGIDLKSGPNQDQPGSDGIGDTPYVIDANNTDNYPLMQPWVLYQSGTIIINADGSITPSTAPIYTADNITYTLTGKITPVADGIVAERNNITIDGAGYAVQGLLENSNGIVLDGVSNVTIRNMTIEAFHNGIYLNSSSSDSISGNNITNNSIYGVYLMFSSNNSISGNNITNNYYGILVHSYSNYNGIYGNNITNNGFNGIGLYFGSTHNNVYGNNITNNEDGVSFGAANYNNVSENIIATNLNHGIELDVSYSNVISGNNITSNNEGIFLESCSDNNVFHNRFVNNTIQVMSSDSVNVWDNGYSSGGNYWSDYNGTDLYSGPYQNVTGSDGIGDTPYVMNANNLDNYPLISTYTNTHMVGDLNGDGKVNLQDLVLLANAYGSKPGDSNWNPNADLAPPYGIISLTDLVTLALHYGQHNS